MKKNSGRLISTRTDPDDLCLLELLQRQEEEVRDTAAKLEIQLARTQRGSWKNKELLNELRVTKRVWRKIRNTIRDEKARTGYQLDEAVQPSRLVQTERGVCSTAEFDQFCMNEVEPILELLTLFDD